MIKGLLLIGTLSLLYYIAVILYAGIRAAFAVFWLALGVCFFAAAAAEVYLAQVSPGLWAIIKNIVLGAGLVFLFVFVLVEIRLVYEGRQKPDPCADYLIVLGAKVKKTVPCRTLYKRIQRACDYLKENPKTRAITSGGQGPGEDMTEAACMAEYLVKMGIDPRRIILEEDSTNTSENLEFSLSLIPKNASVVIVTSGFHIYRAVASGKKKGFQKISGAGSRSDVLMFINYYVREFFAVVKYKMYGDI